jgi:hypothetical protein
MMHHHDSLGAESCTAVNTSTRTDGVEQRRWFVLKGNLLFSYKNVTEFKQRRDPLSIDCLEGYEAVGDGAKRIRLVSALSH